VEVHEDWQDVKPRSDSYPAWYEAKGRWLVHVWQEPHDLSWHWAEVVSGYYSPHHICELQARLLLTMSRDEMDAYVDGVRKGEACGK